MPRKILTPKNLTFQPRPTYPWSPGTKAAGWIYTSGQVAWNDHAELVGPGDVRAQTRQVLKNVESILREGGAAWSDVLKCGVFLADMRYFQAMNDEYAAFFTGVPPPARTTVHAPLAEPEILVEIEAIAYVGRLDPND
jgi:2-iminobutanoate/2-iminopropanoate deaminase